MFTIAFPRRRDDRPATRSSRARRRPLVEPLEGRQLLSDFAGRSMIVGAHIGTSVAEIQRKHVGTSVADIVGNHIGTGVAMIQGAHIGTSFAIQGNHIGTSAAMIQGAHIG